MFKNLKLQNNKSNTYQNAQTQTVQLQNFFQFNGLYLDLYAYKNINIKNYQLQIF